MDLPAQRYVNQLKDARCDEATRSEARRALRNNYLVSQQRDRQMEARSALRLRVQQRIREPQNAVMEQSFFDTIRRTALWWDAICDHAVEQKLHREKAERDKVSNRAEYLHSVKVQECQEQANTLGSDNQRWRSIRDACFQRERELKSAAVHDVVEALLANTSACVNFLDRYAIEDSRNSVLAQFGLSEVIRRSYLPQRADALPEAGGHRGLGARSGSEAFRAIFKGRNPFRMSTPYLPSFLQALFRKTQVEGFAGHAADAPGLHVQPSSPKKLIFDVSRVPVFAVGGAKFSGKSVLTEYLVSAFGFRCFSECDLVAKALRICQQSRQDSDEVHGDTACPEEFVSEWLSLGESIEARLLAGGAVSSSTMAQLLALQLHETQSDPAVRGIVFDGVLNSVEAFRCAQEVVMPDAAEAPLRVFMEEWCGATQPAVVEATVESTAAAAWLPPEAPPAEEPPLKKDNKARAAKKAVDLASLPPPVLPIVEDTSAELNRERVFVEQASQELSSGYGGLVSAFLYIDCPPETIFSRYAGLRVDKETGEEYHMTFRPPPEDRLAHLVNVDRTKVHTAQLADLVFHQQQEWLGLRRWLHHHPTTSASVVVELNGAASVEALVQEAAAAVQQTLKDFTVGLALRDAMHASQERIRQLEATRQAQEAVREAERRRLVELYTEKMVSPLPAELTEGQRGSVTSAAASEAVCDDAGGAAAPASVAALSEVIPRDVPEVVFPAMMALTDAYKSAYDSSWETFSKAANLLLNYRLASQAYTRRYWESTPDGKQAMLDRFVAQFNTLPNSLRSRNACKEELHGLVDELKSALFGSVDARKRECTRLVETTTRRDAFLENWDAGLCNTGALLIQVEAMRFTTIASLVLFYFSSTLGESVVPVEDVDVLGVCPATTANGDGGDAFASAASYALGTSVGMVGGGGGATSGARTSTLAATVPAPAPNANGVATGGGAKRPVTNNARKSGGVASHPVSSSSAGHSSASGGVSADGNNGGGSGSEGAAREAFLEASQRVESMIHGLVDRLRTGTKNSMSKAEKKAAAAASTLSVHAATASTNPAKLSALVAKCLPILESELAQTEERIAAVREFVVELVRQGEAYRQSIGADLRGEVTDVVKAEAAAINSAVYILRCRIEEERVAPHMHLGCGTFALVAEPDTAALSEGRRSAPSRAAGRQPSFLTDVPLYQEMAVRGVKVHATLTAARLLELIDTFLCVAPNYQLSRDDFIMTVTEADYAGAVTAAADSGPLSARKARIGEGGGGGGASSGPSSPLGAPLASTVAAAAAAGESGQARGRRAGAAPLPVVDGLKTVADVFRTFDARGTGFVDWRELIVHLLFWCAPPPRPSMATQLLGRANAGKAPHTAPPRPSSPSTSDDPFYIPEVTVEQLLEMKDYGGLGALTENVFRRLPFFFAAQLSEERLGVFTEALWRTFRDAETSTVDAYALLFFLCSDSQPIRGAQKAFYVLSCSASETGRITRAEMDRIFHTHATNPRSLGQYDPFSQHNQALLFPHENAETANASALLTFEDMCGSLMGRKMLNSLDVLRRKRFVFADVA